MIYINKIINKFLTHLYAKNYSISIRIIHKILRYLKIKFPNISPLFIIEKAIFNIIIPIKINTKKNNTLIKGITLTKCISAAIILIIQKSKLNNNIPIHINISLTLIKIYKKEHLIYKNKNNYLLTFLNK